MLASLVPFLMQDFLVHKAAATKTPGGAPNATETPGGSLNGGLCEVWTLLRSGRNLTEIRVYHGLGHPFSPLV